MRSCSRDLHIRDWHEPLTYVLLRRSCYEAARRKRLAPFRAAGFRCAAAAWALPDAELFARQRRQFLEGGQAVPDEAMADMRGPPSAVHIGHCCVARHGKYS